jgi:hypothetical protein
MYKDELRRQQYVERIQLDAEVQGERLQAAGKRPTLTATPGDIAHDMRNEGAYLSLY